jgi:hypothetical protein
MMKFEVSTLREEVVGNILVVADGRVDGSRKLGRCAKEARERPRHLLGPENN